MKQKKVVIIGGGFAGSVLAKKLESDFAVTLIDKKKYFEFTPGILRAIVKLEHLSKVQVDHATYLQHTTFIHGSVTKITNTAIVVNKKKITFDYLVIASGSQYHTPIKVNNLVNSSHAQVLAKSYTRLRNAKDVLIVGGGIVGAELAAEIVTTYAQDIKDKTKTLTICQAQASLMPRENRRAIAYATRFLERRGVKIIYNMRSTKKEIEAYDLAFFATGITPNASFVAQSLRDDRGFIKVRDTLQLESQDHMFAAGDVANIKEEKLAQTAEVHATLIAHNIHAREAQRQLKAYIPRDRIKLISLGSWDGILTYKAWTFTGIIPGILKSLFEWYHMKHLRYK